MITTTSTGYWATGITVRADGRGRWGGHIDFYDDGFCDDSADTGAIATQGRLNTRYLVGDGSTVAALRAVVDVLLADAQRLGIELRGVAGAAPELYYEGDGEDTNWPPPEGWRGLLAAEAARLGWVDPPAPLYATVTVDDRGKLTDGSTVTVGEWTWPVPSRTANAGVLAPSRIGEALRERGYRMIRLAEHDRTTPGVVRIPIEPDQPADATNEGRR